MRFVWGTVGVTLHIAGQLSDDVALIGQTLPLKFLTVIERASKLVVSNFEVVVE